MDKNIYSRFEAAEYLGYSPTTLDRKTAAGEITCIKSGGHATGKVTYAKADLDDFLERHKRLITIPKKLDSVEMGKKIDTVIDRCPVDLDKFPVIEYLPKARLIVGKADEIQASLKGDSGWYDDPAQIAKANEGLGLTKKTLGLCGRIVAKTALDMAEGILKAVKKSLGMDLPSAPPDYDSETHAYRTPVTVQVYPGVKGTNVIMNRELFNPKKGLEVKNHGQQDFLYSTDVYGKGEKDPRQVYRIPAGGDWTPIPAFVADPRTDVARPGRFADAANLFFHRDTLSIRVTDGSREPVCYADEMAEAAAVKKEQDQEIADLVAGLGV